jgi:hypothetical protein
MPQSASEMHVCTQGWHLRDVIILPEPVGELVDQFGAVQAWP